MADKIVPGGKVPPRRRFVDTGGDVYAEAVSVRQGASEALLVGSSSAVTAASFNRPADTTAYAAGDLIANSTTAGSVLPLTFVASRANDKAAGILRGRLTKSGVTVANAVFRAHFFKDSPTVTGGDNAALASNGALTYLGSIDFDMSGASNEKSRLFSDGVKAIAIPNVGQTILFEPHAASQNIYALLEARAAYVPASGETFTLAIELLRD